MILHVATAITLTILFTAHHCDAQDSDAPQKQYETELELCRDMVKECRVISARFLDGSLSESHQWKEQFEVAAANLAKQRLVLEAAAIKWFFACKKPDQELIKMLGSVSRATFEAGDYEKTYAILERIEKFLPEEDLTLTRRLALAGVKCNKFDRALELARTRDGMKIIGELESQLDRNMFGMSSVLVKNWVRESELRQKEAEEDDLPRVKLQLGADEIILELFENEAPETVANFISLVESGYYDDAFVAPLVKGIVAQAGGFNRSTGYVPVGYVIKNESTLPNARKHFVGSLSMVGDGTKDSASTVFTITIVPNPDLDWDGTEKDTNCQTVFGRVIKGMALVNKLPATEEIDEETQKPKKIKDVTPRVIDKATVIRKRDHDYKFERIKVNSQ